MDQSEIIIGGEYAYLAPGVPGPHEPLKAVVGDDPQGGYVEVTLYHPDTGSSQERVKTRELVGKWDDEPEARYGQHKAAIEAAHAQGDTWTWAKIAEKRYDTVRRQRALAAGLSNLGIRRQGRNYAGQGGTSRKAHDTDLQLNYDEIELLIERANGANPVVPPDISDGPREEDSP